MPKDTPRKPTPRKPAQRHAYSGDPDGYPPDIDYSLTGIIEIVDSIGGKLGSSFPEIKKELKDIKKVVKNLIGPTPKPAKPIRTRR